MTNDMINDVNVSQVQAHECNGFTDADYSEALKHALDLGDGIVRIELPRADAARKLVNLTVFANLIFTAGWRVAVVIADNPIPQHGIHRQLFICTRGGELGLQPAISTAGISGCGGDVNAVIQAAGNDARRRDNMPVESGKESVDIMSIRFEDEELAIAAIRSWLSSQ